MLALTFLALTSEEEICCEELVLTSRAYEDLRENYSIAWGGYHLVERTGVYRKEGWPKLDHTELRIIKDKVIMC